jgi:MscS family membrane protein
MDTLTHLPIYQLVSLLFFGFIVLHILLVFLLKKILTYTHKTKNNLDNYLLTALEKPLKFLIWFSWVYFSSLLLKGDFPDIIPVTDFLAATPIIILTWGVLRAINAIEKNVLEIDISAEKDTVRLLVRLVKISLIIIVGLTLLQNYGVGISSILAFGGMSGMVVGFAAKDMLANIFGGIMIQMDKPFSTGDWIRSSDFEGVVEKIGWRMTRIRTFSKNPIYIPNSIFSTLPIETPSRMTNRRIKEIIGIRYDDIKKLPNILKEIKNLLDNAEGIDTNLSKRVYFNYFNTSSLDFTVYAFTKSTDKDEYQSIKQHILLEIANIIDKNNAEIAFPTQTLHTRNLS